MSSQPKEIFPYYQLICTFPQSFYMTRLKFFITKSGQKTWNLSKMFLREKMSAQLKAMIGKNEILACLHSIAVRFFNKPDITQCILRTGPCLPIVATQCLFHLSFPQVPPPSGLEANASPLGFEYQLCPLATPQELHIGRDCYLTLFVSSEFKNLRVTSNYDTPPCLSDFDYIQSPIQNSPGTLPSEWAPSLKRHTGFHTKLMIINPSSRTGPPDYPKFISQAQSSKFLPVFPMLSVSFSSLSYSAPHPVVLRGRPCSIQACLCSSTLPYLWHPDDFLCPEEVVPS